MKNITVRHIHRSASRVFAHTKARKALCGREIPAIWWHMSHTKGKPICGLCLIVKAKIEKSRLAA